MTDLDKQLAQIVSNRQRTDFQNECHAMSKEALCVATMELYDELRNMRRAYAELLPIAQKLMRLEQEQQEIAKQLGFAQDWEKRMKSQAIDFPKEEL